MRESQYTKPSFWNFWCYHCTVIVEIKRFGLLSYHLFQRKEEHTVVEKNLRVTINFYKKLCVQLSHEIKSIY